MSKEEYKRYIDHSIPFKYNCNGHLIHDCIKNPNRDKYEIMKFIQPKTWMLREIWNHVDIPIVNCPWCGLKLNINFAPEGKRYEVIEEATKEKTIEEKISDSMSWFGHDYREREIQQKMVEQLDKYHEIFPRSVCFGYLINFAEDESLFMPIVISAFVRGLSVLKQSLFMSNTPEYPERYYLKMRQILLLEVSRIEDEFRKEFGKEFREYVIQKHKPKNEIKKERKKQEDDWYWQQTLLDIFEIVDGWIEDFNKERNFTGEN